MNKYIRIFIGYCLLVLPFVFWEYNFCHGNMCGFFTLFLILPISVALLTLLIVIFVIEKNIENTPSIVINNDVTRKNKLAFFYNVSLSIVSIVTPFIVLKSINKTDLPFYSSATEVIVTIIVLISIIASCFKNQKLKEWILIPMIIIEYSLLIIYKSSF